MWHIMMIYARTRIREFVMCGYKGEVHIKQYFVSFHHHHSRGTSIAVAASAQYPQRRRRPDGGRAATA